MSTPSRTRSKQHFRKCVRSKNTPSWHPFLFLVSPLNKSRWINNNQVAFNLALFKGNARQKNGLSARSAFKMGALSEVLSGTCPRRRWRCDLLNSRPLLPEVLSEEALELHRNWTAVRMISFWTCLTDPTEDHWFGGGESPHEEDSECLKRRRRRKNNKKNI